MKTSRLKNIVIVILAFVNVFLLVLLFGRQNQQRVAHARCVEQLDTLLSSSGIDFDTSLLPEDNSISPVEFSRSTDAERAFAEMLLGKAELRSVGGGICVYENDVGSCQFRSNGTVEGTLTCPVSDLLTFCESIFRDCGYAMNDDDYVQALAVSSSGSGTVSALREVNGHFVFASPLSFTFENHTLVSVSGSFLSGIAVSKSVDGIDPISALVRFLDYRNTNGLVCTEITRMEYGYLLQDSTSASGRLIPVWCISAGAIDYYVNFITGHITRS